jgi:phosphoserine phosphatase
MTRMRSVILDCDSTLSTVEGIEELAREHHAEVVELTDAAMRGDVPLEAVYGRRLELVRPDAHAVAALGDLYVSTLVPDAREVIAALRRAGVELAIVSGGLLPAVLVLARALGIDAARVWAVDVRFDAAGGYAGFDAASPLARAGGKRDLLLSPVAAMPRPVMLVGDGATDLEAKPAVDRFVAYAGVAVRASVIEGADAVIRSASLAPLLPLALGDDVPTEPADRTLYEKGVSLL